MKTEGCGAQRTSCVDQDFGVFEFSCFGEECLTMVQAMGGYTGEFQEETSPLSKNEILVHVYMKCG